MKDANRVSLRERFTRIEFVVVIFVVVVALLICFTAIPRALALRDRQSCQANLKTIGEAMRMYSNESKEEFYPRAKMKDCAGNIQPWSGALDLTGFHPEYIKDLELLVCPSYPAGKSAVEIWDQGKTTNPRWKGVEGFSNNGIVEPCEVLAKPYYYYGWALSEATFESYMKFEPYQGEDSKPLKGQGVPTLRYYDRTIHDNRFRQAVLTLGDKLKEKLVDSHTELWELEFPSGKPCELPMGSKIPSLREGAERFYVTEIGNPLALRVSQAKVVVLHEELVTSPDRFYHGEGRMNVLYMDGHVACQTWFPQGMQKFPMNEAGFILRDAVEGTLTYEPQH